MAASKIMIIRHAEKPETGFDGVTSAGTKDNEELIVRGWQRSGALVRFFAPRDGTFADPHLAQPKTIFASKVGKHSESFRPQHTVLELSKIIPNVTFDLHYLKGDEIDLAKAALDAADPVLIAWEHQDIPTIANAIVGNSTTCSQSWPGDRFDVVWVFDKTANGWNFTQVPQLLLSGDSDQPIT